MGAILRCRRRRYLWSLHGVDLTNQQEDDESDDQEAKYGIEKYPVVDGRRTSSLRRSETGIFLARNVEEQVGKIDISERQTNRRHDDVVHQ